MTAGWKMDSEKEREREHHELDGSRMDSEREREREHHEQPQRKDTRKCSTHLQIEATDEGRRKVVNTQPTSTHSKQLMLISMEPWQTTETHTPASTSCSHTARDTAEARGDGTGSETQAGGPG